ncbi:N-acetylneuraminate epimerase [Deinococcus deserti]|uniref:N-acetylneuraminate epimerase n=1 Tax=Deinococcus deserti (strain DSM 17065 / CIP 109153 / LMG 22923 / VCD115) TaxID=546414 RepID=C1D3H8_DEIDV|nr:N-acetylneuraminate epimerase [Deinococcus deserti]ACO48057.1 hypothetical protein Deide_3p01141 [Deinococcus deserti VCD115]
MSSMFRSAAQGGDSGGEHGGTYPDLPLPLTHGVGGIIGTTVYAGLGTAGQKFFALDLTQPNRVWTEVAAFPDPARDQAAAAVANGKLYVFGGIGKSTPEATTAVFHQVHVYDPGANTWAMLNTRVPREIAGGSAVTQGDRILLFGGVNRTIFDRYFEDMAAAGTDKDRRDTVTLAYFNQRPQDYRFSRDLQAYSPATNTWESLGVVPFAGRTGAALHLEGNILTVMNGELKPGLRTPAVHQGVVSPAGVTWRALPDLPPPAAGQVQEGLAGAYTGCSGGALLLAGGTNFPGSSAQFARGTLYAHQGLKKTWHTTVYALRGGRWSIAGQLPQAQGHGLSIQFGDEVLLIGGELPGGTASAKVISVQVKDGQLLTAR